jgi:hypothetical protein
MLTYYFFQYFKKQAKLGTLSIVKYLKQSFPEHLIRVIRATVGVIIIIIGIVQN